MKKNHLYILVIAAIFGLMLVLPASAAISFQKYTPTGNTMYNPVATPISSVPFKNVHFIVQPKLVPWTQTPVDSQIFKPSKITNNTFPIRKSSNSIPWGFTVIPDNPNNITVTAWNQDHSQTVPGTTITFFQYIFPKQSGEGESQGFTGKVIATGVTDSNGRLTVILPDTGGNKVEINAKSPVISENGQMVYYYGFQWLSYQSQLQDVVLTTRVIA